MANLENLRKKVKALDKDREKISAILRKRNKEVERSVDKIKELEDSNKALQAQIDGISESTQNLLSDMRNIIQQKDDRIDDLLERLDNLVVSYQQAILNQCKCDNVKK